MPFYTDPIDVILTGLFAKPRILQPDPSPQATGRCPTCRYLVALPCQVCAAGVQPTRIAHDVLLAREQAQPLSPKAQEIFDLACTWVREHPQRELTADAVDTSDHFPFGRQYVYNHYGKISLLNRMAREREFPRSEHAKMYQKQGGV